MLKVLQRWSIARVNKSVVTHQVRRGQRSLTVLCLQRQSLLLSHYQRLRKCESLVLETPANNAARFLTLTPPKKDGSWFILPFVWSQLTAAAQWLKSESILALSPEIGHPIMDRPQEIKKVDTAKKQESKAVAVVYMAGEPGVGKSQLARKYGENYYNSYFQRTVLMLDMGSFQANCSKLAIKLGIESKVANDWNNPKKIALEMKEVLSNRSNWLLILDNYNSLTYEGLDRDMLERELLPLHGSSEWGSGTVLITTNNAGLISSQTIAESTALINPLSVDESTKLIEQITLTNYKFSDDEKKLLATTVQKRHWRYLPSVMAEIGRYLNLRRRSHTEYNFKDYVKDLENGEAPNPEQAIYKIKLALQNMTKTSDALHKTFRLLAMCPENARIPWVLFEKLMKKYYLENWAHKLDEIHNCTVLTIEYDNKKNLEFLNVHRQHLWAMQDILKHPLKDIYTTEDQRLISTFIDCITEEFDYTRHFLPVITDEYTSQSLHSLFQLLQELKFSMEGSKKFDEEVKMKVQRAWRDADQYLNPHTR